MVASRRGVVKHAGRPASFLSDQPGRYFTSGRGNPCPLWRLTRRYKAG